MTYEEFDKRCDELENAPLQERKTFFADVLAGETEKTDVRMMAFFRYALLFYREGDFLARGKFWNRSSSITKATGTARRSSPASTSSAWWPTMCRSTHCPASTFMRP